jgi:Icc protein
VADTLAFHAQKHPLRIIQLTDLHLCAMPGDILNTGIDTDATLQRVLDELRQHHRHADLLVVTGDLAQDPVAAVYERLNAVLGTAGIPTYCLPGNHDDAALMDDVLRDSKVNTARIVTRGDWLLVLLDSVDPADPQGGRLDAEELVMLDEVLSRHPARNALVCLHHPPVAIGSAWMDRIGLANAEALFAVLDKYPQVRGVVFGHIHQDFETERNGVRLLGTPATCVQFTPGTETLFVDSLPPAWRWLDLHADGRIETGVDYLEESIRRLA